MIKKQETRLTDERTFFKPFHYPWAYDAWLKHEQSHWLHTEVPMIEDVNDAYSCTQPCSPGEHFCLRHNAAMLRHAGGPSPRSACSSSRPPCRCERQRSLPFRSVSRVLRGNLLRVPGLMQMPTSLDPIPVSVHIRLI